MTNLTGADKPTLMGMIAGRKTGGEVRGKILSNGYESNDSTIQRCTGYCDLMGIHSESPTISEALIFSAFLRQESKIPDLHNQVQNAKAQQEHVPQTFTPGLIGLQIQLKSEQ